MKRTRQLALGLSVFVGILISTKLGLKAFTPWSQVTDLWESGKTIKELAGNFHFFRYLVAYPGLYLENMLPGFGFSAYVGLFVAASAMLFRASNLLANSRAPGILAWSIFFAAHAFMNGRGAIAWTAWMLCVKLTIGNYNKRRLGDLLNFRTSVVIAVSTFLSSVTSGVFLVVTASNFMLIASTLRIRSNVFSAPIRLKSLSSFFLSVFIILITLGYALNYLYLAVKKVRMFFDDASGILKHGLGHIISNFNPVVFILLLIVFILVALVLVTLTRRRVHPAICRLLFVGLIGGSLGFTALTLLIPVLTIFFGVAFKGLGENVLILLNLKNQRHKLK